MVYGPYPLFKNKRTAHHGHPMLLIKPVRVTSIIPSEEIMVTINT